MIVPTQSVGTIKTPHHAGFLVKVWERACSRKLLNI